MQSKWWAPRALRLHLTLLVLFPGFIVLGDWQLHRALSGNDLSWAYTVEWPLFSIYAVFVWWRLLHDDDPRPRRRARRGADPEREAAELARYNAYLASLDAEHKRSEAP